MRKNSQKKNSRKKRSTSDDALRICSQEPSRARPDFPYRLVVRLGHGQGLPCHEALARKKQYQKAIEMLGKDWTDKAMWKRFADDACQEYLRDLKELEAMR